MMQEDSRPVSEILKEISSYNGKKKTSERIEDLEILGNELGGRYTIKNWCFNKSMRVAVIDKKTNMRVI